MPSSFFRDRALVRQADIAERDLGDPGRAEAYLRTLLERFPGSLFAPEARTQIQRLRAVS